MIFYSETVSLQISRRTLTFIRAAGDLLKLNMKIWKPVFLTLLSVVLITLAAGAAWKLYHSYSWVTRTRENAEARMKGEVGRMQKFILSIQQIPQNIAYVLEFSNPGKRDLDLIMRSVVENTKEVFGVCVAFEPNAYYRDSVYFAPYIYRNGDNLLSPNPTDTTDNYFSQDWYLIPKMLNRPVWIEPYYDEGSSGSKIVLTTYSVPFYSFDGVKEKMQGIIAIDISMDWLSKVVSYIKLNEGSYCLLVSENGTIISANDQKWPYNESLFSLAEETQTPALREIGRSLQQGKSGFQKIGRFGTDREWWVYYVTIPANQWGLLLMIPENQ